MNEKTEYNMRMKRAQIEKLLATSGEPHRAERELADNTGFSTPGGCASMAYHKASRLLNTDSMGNVRLYLHDDSPECYCRAAEEARDVANYWLQIAGLLEEIASSKNFCTDHSGERINEWDIVSKG